jgi:hypothetical protein
MPGADVVGNAWSLRLEAIPVLSIEKTRLSRRWAVGPLLKDGTVGTDNIL